MRRFVAGTLVCALVAACSSEQSVTPSALAPATSPDLQVSNAIALTTSLAWQVLAPAPSAVRAAAGASDVSRVYLLGGDAGASTPTNLNRIYNPSTNSWATGAPFGGARDFAMALGPSGEIHLLGGAGAGGLFADHQIYNRSTNAWSTGASLPIPVDAAAIRTVAGKLYVIGGGSATGPTGAVQIFNPATNTWSSGAPMPTPRLSAASSVLSDKIYVAGGQTAGIGPTTVLERYDPVANTWKALAPMPVSREALGGGQVAGLFCVFGGRTAQANPTGNAFPGTYCYNPVNNQWTRGPNMITPRVEVAIANFASA